MTSVTVRMPDDLMARIREIAARDYSKDAATLRRIVRLGIEADERRERVDAPRQPVEAAS
jgi:predicted transcriptional regulator